MSKASVLSVNISEQKGTIKNAVPSIDIASQGITGDAHAGAWHRQVSILSQELIDAFQKSMDRSIAPGEFAENITTTGLDLASVGLLDRIRIGEVELEVTQIGKECHGDTCAIFREVGKCVMPKEGIFTRVIKGGSVQPGDVITHEPKPFKIDIVVLSDRATRGEYEDRSGPTIRDMFNTFFSDKRWHPQIQLSVLPDDATQLKDRLSTLHADGVDLIITTGGTGVGPRDITPEIVTPFCDRLIPGIMEHIRIKYGQDKPNALLSRSVAGVKGQMLIYALPGSVRAVKEYMEEILKTLEHLVMTVQAVDTH